MGPGTWLHVGQELKMQGASWDTPVAPKYSSVVLLRALQGWITHKKQGSLWGGEGTQQRHKEMLREERNDGSTVRGWQQLEHDGARQGNVSSILREYSSAGTLSLPLNTGFWLLPELGEDIITITHTTMIMVIYRRRSLSTHIHVFLMGKSVKKTVPRLSWSGVTVSDAALLYQFLVMTLWYACPSKPGLLCAADLSWKHHTSCRHLATFLSPRGVCVESDPTEVTVSRNLAAQNPCGILWII